MGRAEEAQAREQAGVLELEPLSTPRIVPEWQLGSVSDFIFGATETPAPSATPGVQPGSQQAMQPGTMTQAPTATPATQPGAISNATLAPDDTDLPENLEYIPASDSTPSPTPRPTATPAPTPAPTADPGGMTVEEEE